MPRPPSIGPPHAFHLSPSPLLGPKLHDSVTCTCNHYAGLPAPRGQVETWLLLTSVSFPHPQHPAECLAHTVLKKKKKKSWINKLLVWITTTLINQILPGENIVFGQKYSEKQTNSFRFTFWKIQRWSFSALSIRVKSQHHPQLKNITYFSLSIAKSLSLPKALQLLSQLRPKLQLLSPVSRWLSKMSRLPSSQLISPSPSPPQTLFLSHRYSYLNCFSPWWHCMSLCSQC